MKLRVLFTFVAAISASPILTARSIREGITSATHQSLDKRFAQGTCRFHAQITRTCRSDNRFHPELDIPLIIDANEQGIVSPGKAEWSLDVPKGKGGLGEKFHAQYDQVEAEYQYGTCTWDPLTNQRPEHCGYCNPGPKFGDQTCIGGEGKQIQNMDCYFNC